MPDDTTLPPPRDPGFPPLPAVPPQVMPAEKPATATGKTLRWIAWGVTVAAVVVPWVLYLTGKGPQPDSPPIIPPIPQQVSPAIGGDDGPPPNAFGWVPDPEAVRAVEGTLPFKVFGETPAGQDDTPLPRSAYLWEAHRKLTGQNPPAMDQNPVGSCVSFGTSRAVERALAVEIVRGSRYELRHLVEEAIYGGSRVQVGGGRISGDGSVGAWAADFMRRWGGLPRGKWHDYDLTKYDPNRCRAWGRTGVPDDLEPDCKRFPAGDVTRVQEWSAAKRAMANGCGIAICSNQGFTRQRDANGVCRASGEWAHCMALDGYHTDEAGREYGHIENSWGPNYHVGPTGWGNPSTAGFWAEASVIDRMLRQGDSWAFSGVKGFPKRNLLDWIVQNDIRPARQRIDDTRPLFALAP